MTHTRYTDAMLECKLTFILVVLYTVTDTQTIPDAQTRIHRIRRILDMYLVPLQNRDAYLFRFTESDVFSLCICVSKYADSFPICSIRYTRRFNRDMYLTDAFSMFILLYTQMYSRYVNGTQMYSPCVSVYLDTQMYS